MNPFDILKNFDMKEIQKKSEEAAEKMKEIRATGEAGGGFVKVTLTGDFKIVSIDYDDGVDFIKDDLNTFRDLIIAAHNDASNKIKEEIKTSFSSSMIPGLM